MLMNAERCQPSLADAQNRDLNRDPSRAFGSHSTRNDGGDHNAAAEMVHTIEDVRVQLQGLEQRLASDAAAADLRRGADSLEQKFVDVEGRILDLRITGRGQDGVRWPVRLAGQLDYVASTISASDFAPTVQQREVATVLAKETRDVHAALRGLINNDLSAFNSRLRARGLQPIEVRVPPVVF